MGDDVIADLIGRVLDLPEALIERDLPVGVTCERRPAVTSS
jgi:hypothetical protein